MMKDPGMNAKRQKLPGLWVVSTPIGNLSDFTERAREVLAGADWIACEDTRRTAQLLQALGIVAPPLRRCDAHSEANLIRKWAREMLEGGLSVALVTDAGTPGVSDPGAVFVREAVAAGIGVSPVPGASSWMALVAISGWPEVNRWVCEGFFPRKKGDRESAFRAAWASAQACPEARTGQIWLESPERIEDTLTDLEECLKRCPVEAEWIVSKELTKLHERAFRGGLHEVAQAVRAHLAQEGARGEWCFAVRFPRVDAGSERLAPELESLMPTVESLLDAGVKISEIARILSHRFGVEREKIYSLAGSLKKNRGEG
jgi:16S rRNA (cytidine1402-2'-O)-methyltransferase